jgi:hypothetical protein
MDRRRKPRLTGAREGELVLEASYEMTFTERIEGPLGPTNGSPPRLCWEITEASLAGERISATLAMPGSDWIRLDADGTRRQDQRAQFRTEDGALILMRYDTALIRPSETFAQALASGSPTTFADQYMRMSPRFEVSTEGYAWLTQHLFVGVGRLAGSRRIEYEIYRIL